MRTLISHRTSGHRIVVGMLARRSILAAIVLVLSLATIADSVDPALFEAAYKSWSDHQRIVDKTYGNDPITRQPPTPSPSLAKKKATEAPSKEMRRLRRELLDEDSSSSSDKDDDDALPTRRPTAAPVNRNRNKYRRDDPQEEASVNPTVEEKNTKRSGWPLTYQMKSFTKTCGKQSELLCDEPNPFISTYCLIANKASLSQSCSEYVTAKVNCFMTARKLCPEEGKSHLACLYENRNQKLKLPSICTKTSFFAYISGGIAKDDETNEKLALEVSADGV